MIRHGWQIVSLVLFLLLSSGCAQKKGWSSFPVTIYADSTVTSSSQKESDLKDAMSFWEQKAGHQLFNYQGVWKGDTPYSGGVTDISSIQANVLMFQSPWPFASNVAGQTTVVSNQAQINGAVIMINPNINYCTGDCTGDTTSTSQRKDFTHELGHFLGLAHIQDVNNIMYPVLQPGGSLENVTIDQQTFDGLVNN